MLTLLSPLRYPGSKRRLAKFIDQMLHMNNLHPELFVELFAGGASVALQLLNNNSVEAVGLVEIDPLVVAFWQTVFSPDPSEVQWLVEQVYTIDITLERWRAFKSHLPASTRERALACLFLNRTSFSGIIAPSGGPLGGYNQQSAYPIDCRFPRNTIADRILMAASYTERVRFVWSLDWLDAYQCIERQRNAGQLPTNTFYYLDPPFFEKANRLYTHYFIDQDHERLRDHVLTFTAPWLLSYDYSHQVDKLYANHQNLGHVEALYSAAQCAGNRAVREAILTNLPILPANNRLWQIRTQT